VAAARRAAAERRERVEVVSARTESTQLFANPDGTMSWEAAAGPVRVRRGGEWVDVDTTLESVAGRVRPRAVPVELAFSAGGDGALARLGEPAGGPGPAGTGPRAELGLDWAGTLPTPELAGNTATYRDVVPGGDLVVTALTRGFAEALVLRERPAGPVTLRFRMRTGALRAALGRGGELRLTDAAGRLRAKARGPGCGTPSTPTAWAARPGSGTWRCGWPRVRRAPPVRSWC
jgi:hypothetical protein